MIEEKKLKAENKKLRSSCDSLRMKVREEMLFIIYIYMNFGSEMNGMKLVPVVRRADRMAAGLQRGWIFLRRATIAATWGHDMDVPDMNMYGLVFMTSSPLLLFSCAPEYAPSTCTPGAVISG